MIRVKEAHEPADPRDGVRVLVERRWPRSLSRSRGPIALWLRALAPSPGLRRWVGGHSAPAGGKHLRFPDGALRDKPPRAGGRVRTSERESTTESSSAASRVRMQIFRKKYFQELKRPEAGLALEQLHDTMAESAHVTLLYTEPKSRRGNAGLRASVSKPPGENHAVVLKQLLEGLPKPPLTTGPEKAVGAKKANAKQARSAGK